MQNILRKMSISVMVSLLVLVTFGAITFAWVGISTYSRIENFDLDLEAQELKEYGLEISLTGLEGSFKPKVDSTELKRQILINYYNDDNETNKIKNYSEDKVNSEFNALILDQATIDYNSNNNSFLNDEKTDFNFIGMHEKEDGYILGRPTTKLFKFDIYLSAYKINDVTSVPDGLEPGFDLSQEHDGYRVDAFLDGKIFKGTRKKVGTIFDYTYPNNYLSGYINIPTNVIQPNTNISGLVECDSSDAARIMFAKRGVVNKYHPEEYQTDLSKNKITNYKIYHTGSVLPTYDEDSKLYSFGGILKDDANFALQNFNQKHPDIKKSLDLANAYADPDSEAILTREETDIYYDYKATDQASYDAMQIIHSVKDSDDAVTKEKYKNEQIGIRHMMKMTIYFWFEGWDSDCFDVIDRSPVSISINLVAAKATE